MSEAKPALKPAGRGRNLELSEELKAYKGVWVFIEHERGHVHSVSWELLGEGRKLADQLGSPLCGVVLGGPTSRSTPSPAKRSPSVPTMSTSCATRCSTATATSLSPKA